MKKRSLFLSVTVMLTMVLSSCGSSIESDAKKAAELQCEAEKLMEKASSGDLSVMEESKELASEAEALSKELEEKYTSDSDSN
jgi:ribosomal protein L17